jgi:hypothetical protein
MAVKVASITVSKIYLGGNLVSKIYLGGTQIYTG